MRFGEPLYKFSHLRNTRPDSPLSKSVPTVSPRAPRIHDLVVGSERDRIGSGALLAIGLFTRPVAFILSGNMAVAYFMAHAPKSFFPLLNGGDGSILYCLIFLLFFVAGPGRWSVDAKVRESSSKVYDAGRDQFPQRAVQGGEGGSYRQRSSHLISALAERPHVVSGFCRHSNDVSG
jgi:hypothetical protein